MSERGERRIRVTMPDGRGPILVEGPVEVRLPDGRICVSDRPVVALCACRRSRRYPFCDTSHRRRGHPPADGASGNGVRKELRPARQQDAS